MAIDLVAYSLKNASFSINSLNLGPINTSGWAILSVRVKYSSKLFRNQREDGSYIVDGRVLLPLAITVTVIAQSKSAEDIINQVLRNRSTVYTINTRGMIYNNMVLQNEGLNQDSENISSQPVQLSFREILVQNSDAPETRQEADSNVVERGISYIKETTTTVTNLASSILSKIGGII